LTSALGLDRIQIIPFDNETRPPKARAIVRRPARVSARMEATVASSAEIHGLLKSPLDLATLVDAVPMGLALLDEDRRVVLFNRALEALTGFDRELVRGVPCRDVLRSSFCPQSCPALEAARSHQAAVRKGDIINRDRRRIPIRLTSLALRDAAGKPVGFLETVEDYSQRLRLGEGLEPAFGVELMIGRSPKMEELFRMIPVIAQTDSSVLITGETGTGKDLLAEALHRLSGRAREPFIKVNCGALPETLLESELFGHKKGAFTGAVADKPGRLRLAHGGSLYLTEIGDLPLPLQVKLLTFLDDRVVYPLGDTRGYAADVRIIAATNHQLEEMVREGRFRADLLFRLNVVRLHLAPLRERAGDAALLLSHFLARFSSRFQKKIRGFSDEARERLLVYAYPGNVRELRNIVEYAVNVCQEPVIGLEHLPVYLTEAGAKKDAPLSTGSTALLNPESEANGPVRWTEIEKRLIVNALIRAGGRRKEAADLLGWGRSTLWRKMKQYGLDS